jgi:toxin ParE1/3/4
MASVLAFRRELFGQRQCVFYHRIIREALEELADDPQTPRSKQRPEIHVDARTMHLGGRGRRARHLFLYRIKDNRFVDIARLLHDSMELDQHLRAEFTSED